MGTGDHGPLLTYAVVGEEKAAGESVRGSGPGDDGRKASADERRDEALVKAEEAPWPLALA